MLETPMEKQVDDIQEHMGNISIEINIVRKNQKKMLEIKNSNKNTFHRVIFRSDMVQKK